MMHPGGCKRCEIELEHVDHVKVGDVEYFDGLVMSAHRRHQHSIVIHTHVCDRT